MTTIIINPASLTPLAKGVLKTAGKTYYIGFLDEIHINEMKAFHDHISATLRPGEEAYFLQKPRSFFAGHFQKGNGNAVIGIVTHDGELIAQAIILNPSANHPETGMVDMEPVASPEEITVFQGAGVLPEYRGNGLMHVMVRHWLDYAVSLGKKHALAEIDTRNIASWSVVLKEGLNLVSTGIDPDDGTLVYNAHEDVETAVKKRLPPFFNNKAGVKSFASRLENIEWHQKLFAERYKVIAYNREQQTLIFEKKEPDMK